MRANEISSIKKLIEAAKDEHIWLPEFQRPFVWDEIQIKLLIDSIYRDYTINSILIWDGENVLARRRIGGSIKQIMIPLQDDKTKITYLLDGQQRTTALLAVFTDQLVYKGNNAKKNYSIELYFDKQADENEPELKFIYDVEKIIDKNGEHTSLKNVGSFENIIKRFGLRFIRLKDVYKKNVKELINILGNDYAEYDRSIDELNERILQQKLTVIEQHGSLENVLDVFERINTRNTKLNIFDIMVAKTYRIIDDKIFDLRSFLKMINYDERLSEDYFTTKVEIDYEGSKEVLDGSTMLFLIMLLLDKGFSQTQILSITTEDLLANFNFIHKSFNEIIGELNNYFKIEKEEVKNFQPILKFITAFHTENNKLSFEPVKKSEFLKKWFWNTVLYNRYPGAQNERISKDIDILKKNGSNFQNSLKEMIKDRTRSFDEVRKSSTESPQYFEADYESKNQQIYSAFYLLLKSKEPKDFRSGIIPQKGTRTSTKINEHHIFPINSVVGKQISADCEQSDITNRINNIANICIITDTTNKSIQHSNPSKYIKEIMGEYKKLNKENEFINMMESQFINQKMIDYLLKDDFNNFIYDRTMLLNDEIKKLSDVS